MTYRTGKFIRRHLVATSLTAALVLSLLFGGIGVSWQRLSVMRERHERSQAELQLQKEQNERLRDHLVPMVRALVDEDEWFEAFRLIESAFPDALDAELKDLRDQVSRVVSIDSTPMGALVEIRHAAQTNRGWMTVGVTPLKVHVPRGMYHWRVSKDGYDRLLRLDNIWDASSKSFDLHNPLGIPAEMVMVSGIKHLPLPHVGHVRQDLGPYAIDQFEVTNEQFQRFVDERGYGRRSLWKHEFLEGGQKVPWREAMKRFCDTTGQPGPSTWANGRHPHGQADYPVRGISWYEAAAYTQFANKALPTIYHWIGAAAKQNQTRSIVPYSNIGYRNRDPAAVGKYEGIGPFGTFDMIGNVKEWCWNGDGSGKRFLLGGAWHEPAHAFSDWNACSPWERSQDCGVRCVRYLSDTMSDEKLVADFMPTQRDFRSESPCSDDDFDSYQREFHYSEHDVVHVVSETTTRQGFRCERIVFDPAYKSDDRVVAYLYFPEPLHDVSTYQTVVLLPYRWNNKVAEQGGLEYYEKSLLLQARAVLVPVLWGTYERDRGQLRLEPEQFLAKRVFENGRAAFMPVLWGTRERIRRQLSTMHSDSTVPYREAVIRMVQDVSRSVDYLLTRSDIDHDGIALFGGASSSALVQILMATEPRFHAVVLHNGGLIHTPMHPAVDPINFVTRAKAPTLMINGEYHVYCPVESSQKPLYDLLPLVPPNKRHHIRGTTIVTRTSILVGETTSWLDLHLGPVR